MKLRVPKTPTPAPRSMRGAFYLTHDANGLHARAWPVKRPKKPQAYQLWKQVTFGKAGKTAARMNPLDYEFSVSWTKDTTMVPRDIMTMNVLGVFWELHMPDGTIMEGIRLQPNPQLILDLLGDTPGSLIFRHPAGWTLIPPGTAGQVLIFNSTESITWEDGPPAPPPDVQDVLDQLTPSPGDTIAFDGADWIATPPPPFPDVQDILDELAPTKGDMIIFDGTDWTVTASPPSPDVQDILDQLSPSKNDMIVFDGTDWTATAQPTPPTIQDLLDDLSPTAGDMIIFDGDDWIVLPAGTEGQYLSIDETGMPVWLDPPDPPPTVVNTVTGALTGDTVTVATGTPKTRYQVFVALRDFSIHSLFATISQPASGGCILKLWTLSGTANSPTIASIVTAADNKSTDGRQASALHSLLTTPVDLEEGDLFAIACMNNDDVAAVPVPMWALSNGVLSGTLPVGVMRRGTESAFNPSVGTNLSPSSTANQAWGVGFEWSLSS